MKGPIPSEHLVLQETFNGLAERCKNTANNPVSGNRVSSVIMRCALLSTLDSGYEVYTVTSTIIWSVVIVAIERRGCHGKQKHREKEVTNLTLKWKLLCQ